MSTDISSHIGHRRTEGWWEPIYNPDLDGTLSFCSWDFANSTGPEQSYMSAETLIPTMTNGQVKKFVGITFRNCDFQGKFLHNPSILFDKCKFHQCDFGFSSWFRINFRKCDFFKCSFSLCSFEECEFRDCSWEQIGFSGSKTVVNKSFITNPEQLIRAGFSGTRPNQSEDKKHVAYQKFRLSETQSHLARNILTSHEIVGDDRTYYKTARLHDLQQVRFRIRKSAYNIRFAESYVDRITGLSLVFWILELWLIFLVGLTNGWGAKLFQPLLILILSFILFAGIYHAFPTTDGRFQPWQKSFDVTALAGYTNQSSANEPSFIRVLVGVQLVISIFLYTIFFSTAVARFSRAR